jgi:hypothetical protein
VLDAPSYHHLAYRVGVPLATTLLTGGLMTSRTNAGPQYYG